MRFNLGFKLGLASVLLLSVLLLSACGQGQLLGSLLIEERASNAERPQTPHTVEGRDGFCLTCHVVDDVSLGDTTGLEDSGIIKPGQTTHEGLSAFTCVTCHSPTWRSIKSTGLPKPVGGEEDCEACHGVRPNEPSPH